MTPAAPDEAREMLTDHELWVCLRSSRSPVAMRQLIDENSPATSRIRDLEEQVRVMREALNDLHGAFDFEERVDATEMGFSSPDALNGLFAKAYAALVAAGGTDTEIVPHDCPQCGGLTTESAMCQTCDDFHREIGDAEIGDIGAVSS